VTIKPLDNDDFDKSLSAEDTAKRIAEAHAKVRAGHGVLDAKQRGQYSGLDSFRGDYDLSQNPGRSHNLSTHFYSGTAAYELMRKFEHFRKKHPREDCFVYAGIPLLLSSFLKGDPKADEKKHRSRMGFFGAMKLLRELGCISPRLTIDGHEGYVIAPHFALCHETEDGKTCEWIGPTNVNRKKRGLVGFFRQTPDGWRWLAEAPKYDEE
jgi:hypothetical protein